MSEEKLYYKEIEEKDGFITAKQAREMTNKVIEEFVKKDTLKKIQAEIKLGHNSCVQTVHQNIDVEIVLAFLRGLGYNVKIINFNNHRCDIKISW